MTSSKKKSRPAGKSSPAAAARLTRDDWLDAAFYAVVEGGFDAVRVLMLADTLGVTRGSFYWHFTDHAELVSALLQRWHKRELETTRRSPEGRPADTPADTPDMELKRVLDFALAHAGKDLENMRFELALRGLGRRDAAVAAMLAEVDQTRLKLFEHKFARLTGDAKTAAELAGLFYLAIVGSYQALARPGNPPRLELYLKGIIGKYLIQAHAPGQSIDASK